MIREFIAKNNLEIESGWQDLTKKIDSIKDLVPFQMDRKEISFHSDVKLLGYISKILSEMEGDILEIGVWKGKSLFFMEMYSKIGKVIGIDPCVFENQAFEIDFFKDALKSNIILIKNFSEASFPELLGITSKLKLVHIDGGHLQNNVIWDFMLYSPLIIQGGYLIFDDYSDQEFSPEVKFTVELLKENYLLDGFELIGVLPEFSNSFVLLKK